LDRLYGFVIHECGHHQRPEAFNILNAAQPPEELQAIFNITEDDGMERERAFEWRGDCKALSITNEGLISEFNKILQEKGAPVIEDPCPLVTMFLGQLSRLHWDEYSGGAISAFMKAQPDNVKDLLTTLEGEGWVTRFQETVTVEDTWNLACDLIKRLYPDDDDHSHEEYEKLRQAGLDGKDTGPTDEQMKAQANESGEGEEEASRLEDDMRVISWKDVVLSDHEINKGGPPGGYAIDWNGYHGQSHAFLCPTDKIKVIDLSKDSEIETVTEDSFWTPPVTQTGWKKYMPQDKESRQFANRVRRHIQARARSVVDKEKYHGKLDKSALVRLALPPIDGGEYNKKIFYDQRKHTMKDTCIFVLTDWSGSMDGTKMKYAADASQRLVYTFERILNIPVALAAFSDRFSDCDIGYIKKYHTRGLPAETIARRFEKFYQFSSGNNDADAVHWAWKQIKKRKETRKILIVISDGAPTDSWKGHAHHNLKYITSAIEKDREVELYGVGVCSNAVRNYYTNYKVLNDPSEINATLFNLIKDGDNANTR
jgi:cobaltochelatase CobT